MAEPPARRTGLESVEAFEASLTAVNVAEDGSVYDLDEDAVATVPESDRPDGGWDGKRLGKFRLVRVLGDGAMGRVILAEDLNVRRSVALKVMARRVTDPGVYPDVRKYFHDAIAVSRLGHPHLVEVFDINHVHGWWYVAMEYLEGGSLFDSIRKTGALPPEEVCPLFADAATALDAIHKSGFVHRDVKPANLLRTRTGRCKMTDFCLTKLKTSADPFGVNRELAGTPWYISPEAIRQTAITSASDVYSLGCSLFHTLAGRPPYTGETVDEVLKQHTHAPPPDLRDALPHCSPTLAQLIQRMTSKQPDQRPTALQCSTLLRAESIGQRRSTSSMVGSRSAMLHGSLAGELSDPQPTTRIWAILVLFALLTAVGIVLVVFLLGGLGSSSTPTTFATPTPTQAIVPPPPSDADGLTTLSPMTRGIRISRLLINPSNRPAEEVGNSMWGEWNRESFWLTNVTDRPIDLGGWRFENASGDFITLDGMLQPGEERRFSTAEGEEAGVGMHVPLPNSDGGSSVRLFDANNDLAHAVEWQKRPETDEVLYLGR